jgi:tRNA (cytidine/uridine-2'-O-)-methyltransferase
VLEEMSISPSHGKLTLALYQPDIPQNAGTMLRLCACLGVDAAIIGPAGFPTGDRHFRRSGMDYLDHVSLARHNCFSDFTNWRAAQVPSRRLILLTTKASALYWDCSYRAGDILMVGRESAGVPEEVAACADVSVTIPMQPGMRSLNVAVAAAMVIGEALRQIRGDENAA